MKIKKKKNLILIKVSETIVETIVLKNFRYYVQFCNKINFIL
jgi:hypothetical protein